MERLGVGRITVIATVGTLALSGCQATPGEVVPTSTSSSTTAHSVTQEATETATFQPEATQSTAVTWAVPATDSADRCPRFTDALGSDLLPPELVTFRSIFFGPQGDKFIQLGEANDGVCSWMPTKSAEQKSRATTLHIATIPGSEDFDAAATFDEFESSAEGQSLGSTAYATQPLGNGTVYLLDDLVHGETVNADICHYVEGRTVVTITREHDGQCVAALEQVLAIAKG